VSEGVLSAVAVAVAAADEVANFSASFYSESL
jgi:hypothetical protein